MPAEKKKTYSVGDIAAKFNVAKAVAHRWVVEGRFPGAYQDTTYKIGKGHPWLIPAEAVEAFTPPKPGRPRDENPSDAALKKRQLRESKKTEE